MDMLFSEWMPSYMWTPKSLVRYTRILMDMFSRPAWLYHNINKKYFNDFNPFSAETDIGCQILPSIDVRIQWRTKGVKY